jgi:hypothetical protein
MAKTTLALDQAAALVGRMKAAAEGKGRFVDIVMPNGQKLKDCTFDYVAEIGEAMRAPWAGRCRIRSAGFEAA